MRVARTVTPAIRVSCDDSRRLERGYALGVFISGRCCGREQMGDSQKR